MNHTIAIPSDSVPQTKHISWHASIEQTCQYCDTNPCSSSRWSFSWRWILFAN